MSQDGVLPVISVVMAAYNEERNIGRAIESILHQTFSEWELIIVNDGSRDATTDVVQHYAKNDSRIRLVINSKNLGLPASLNIGIGLAKAEIIARADADDINLPERFAKQYEYMQAHSDIDVLGTSAILLDAQCKPINILSLPQTHGELKNLTFLKTHFIHPSVMIRKSFFNKIGMYDLSFPRVQDKELWLRGLRAGCRYANLSEPLIEYSTNGYVRSWRSIRMIVLSQLRLVHVYRVKYGYYLVFISLIIFILIKLNVYKRKSLRGSAHC